MEYELTQHASEVILERDIALSWIELTLNDPAIVENDSGDEELEHRFRSIYEFGNRTLHVVVNRKKVPILIVTTYFDRTRKGKI